ncbi:MAG: hypothetical protein ACLP22_04535, partial [Solirubrobacteraceae bacterium]
MKREQLRRAARRGGAFRYMLAFRRLSGCPGGPRLRVVRRRLRKRSTATVTAQTASTTHASRATTA